MGSNVIVKIFVSLLLLVVFMVIFVIQGINNPAYFAGPSHRKHPELAAEADPLPTTSSTPVLSRKTHRLPTTSSTPVLSRKPDRLPTTSSTPVLSRKPDRLPTTSSTPALVRKSFIYLTQTESCATKELLAWAGNSSSCNCDAIVASYKVPCDRIKSFPTHIQHIFTPGTTWGSGRNVLFFTAWNRNPGYQYYIFMDDDVTPTFNAFAPPEMAASLDPFRAFERFLLDYEPALGVMGYGLGGRQTASASFRSRKNICGKNGTPLAVPESAYDANFNAFHRDAVPHLLPYRIKYDYDSFYHAVKSVKVATYIKFRGQTLMFTATDIQNPKHRPYQKRGPLSSAEVWREWIRVAQKATPPEFQNNKQFKEMLADPEKWTAEGGGVTCLDAIKHQPIIPYEHFRRAAEQNPKKSTSS